MAVKKIKKASGVSAGRARLREQQEYERIAYYIMVMWLLLPVVIFGVLFLLGIAGENASTEEILEMGLTPGYSNNMVSINAYKTLFFILGTLTFFFDLASLLLFRDRYLSRESLRAHPWFCLFALFLLWATISTLCSNHKLGALFGTSYMCDGLASYFIYGSVFLCASVIRQERLRGRLIRQFVAEICFFALWMLIQECADNDFINYCFPAGRAVVFNQFNHFGYMLCLADISAFGLFLYERPEKKGLRVLYLLVFFYLFYALTVNDTFGGMLAVIVSVPVALVFYARSGRKLNLRTLWIALLAVALAGVCFYVLSPGLRRNFLEFRTDLVKIITRAEDAGEAGTKRLSLWRETLAVIAQHPILGLGPEGVLLEQSLSGNIGVHNTYLQIAAYTGIPGLLLYLSALFLLARHHWKRIRALRPMELVVSGAAFAYLASAFVGAPVFNTEPYFWMYLGLIAFSGEEDRQGV